MLLAVIPLLGIAGGFLAKVMAAATTKEQNRYGKAGAVVEEVFSAIRTVAAYSSERFEIQRFADKLADSKKEAIKKALLNGTGLAIVMFIMFNTYGLAFYWGSILVSRGTLTPGGILSVFFSIVRSILGPRMMTPCNDNDE